MGLRVSGVRRLVGLLIAVPCRIRPILAADSPAGYVVRAFGRELSSQGGSQSLWADLTPSGEQAQRLG
jgi:hypothetical protein